MNILLFFLKFFCFYKIFWTENKLKDETPTENTLVTFKAENSCREISVSQRPYAVKWSKLVTGRTERMPAAAQPWTRLRPGAVHSADPGLGVVVCHPCFPGREEKGRSV